MPVCFNTPRESPTRRFRFSCVPDFKHGRMRKKIQRRELSARPTLPGPDMIGAAGSAAMKESPPKWDAAIYAFCVEISQIFPAHQAFWALGGGRGHSRRPRYAVC